MWEHQRHWSIHSLESLELIKWGASKGALSRAMSQREITRIIHHSPRRKEQLQALLGTQLARLLRYRKCESMIVSACSNIRPEAHGLQCFVGKGLTGGVLRVTWRGKSQCGNFERLEWWKATKARLPAKPPRHLIAWHPAASCTPIPTTDHALLLGPRSACRPKVYTTLVFF